MPYRGYVTEIENTLEAKQMFVGGTIQCVHLTDEIDLICNDEGKLIGLPPNRAWFYDGKVIDVLVGNCLCCRHHEGDFTSIHQEDVPVILNALRPLVDAGDGKHLMPLPEYLMPVYKDIEEARRLFYKGRKLKLLSVIDDPFTPKKAGDIFTVSYVDDVFNIHGSWEGGGSMAIIYGEDSFEILE